MATKKSGKKNPAAVALGRLGGQKKVPKGVAKLSDKERSERGKAAAAARWGKKNPRPKKAK